jgi:uncharacterized membrane protein
MKTSLRAISTVLALALAACAGTAALPDAGSEPAPAPVMDAQQSIPAEFVLATNEPFWQARVEAGVVVLTGLDGQRRFEVDRNEALFDGRLVMAHDATGTLELRVTEILCLDNMSGEQFPYTGRLAIDGASPVAGCGRPWPSAP